MQWVHLAEGFGATTLVADPVRWVKVRRRIRHDQCEIKHGLGPGHFKGRAWCGRRHRVTLATAAQAFPSRGSSTLKSAHRPALRQVLDFLQDLLRCRAGACTTCGRPPLNLRSRHTQRRTRRSVAKGGRPRMQVSHRLRHARRRGFPARDDWASCASRLASLHPCAWPRSPRDAL